MTDAMMCKILMLTAVCQFTLLVCRPLLKARVNEQKRQQQFLDPKPQHLCYFSRKSGYLWRAQW